MADELHEYLSRFLKIESLNPEQKEALEFLLSGRDVLAILPTEFGKSNLSIVLPGKAVFKSEEYAIERPAFGFSTFSVCPVFSFPGKAVLVALLVLAECCETDIHLNLSNAVGEH